LLLLLVASEALLDSCCGSLVTGDNVAAGGHVHPTTNIAKMEPAFALFVCVARICLPRLTDVRTFRAAESSAIPDVYDSREDASDDEGEDMSDDDAGSDDNGGDEGE